MARKTIVQTLDSEWDPNVYRTLKRTKTLKECENCHYFSKRRVRCKVCRKLICYYCISTHIGEHSK